MALPAAQQARLDALKTEGTAPTGEQPVVEVPATVEEPVVTRPEGENVTITRQEFNNLQAAADRVKAAEGKLELAQMERETLEARLTALENASKGNGKGEGSGTPTPSEADDWSPGEVTLTDQEKADYGESAEFVEKIALTVFNREFAKIFPNIKSLKGKLSQVEEAVTSTSRRTEEVEGRDFNDQVKSQLKEAKLNFDDIVNHEHWRAFAESEDPQTGITYAEVLFGGHRARKVGVVVRVMKDFATKYGLKRPETTGYEGGMGNGGGSSRIPDTTGKPEKLPFSARRAAHKQFLNKEITDAEYQRICNDYSQAEKEDRIDYNA